MRFNIVFLEGLQPQNLIIMFLFSMKHPYLLTVKTTQDVNSSLRLLHGMKELLRAILCVRSNYWCLIMVSTKMMQYVYVTSLYNFVSKIYNKYQSSLF